MKRWRRIFLLLIGCGVLAVLVLMIIGGDREPEYDGKTLSEWLWEHSRGQHTAEAEKAVNQIGTRALPWLVSWTGYEYPAWKIELDRRIFKMPEPLRGVARRLVRRNRGLQLLGLEGFRILRSRASPAVPELARLMTNWTRVVASAGAAAGLASIGEAGLPPLVDALTNAATPSPWRCRTAMLIGFMGTNASAAVPVLVRCMKDREEAVAEGAADALGALGVEPGLVVRALADGTTDSRPLVRASAARALGGLGPQARSAIECLVHALGDPDHAMREEATNALLKIAPEVLGQTNRVERRKN